MLREMVTYSDTLDSDDATISALKFGGDFRRPGFFERLKGYAKLIVGFAELKNS